MRTQGTRVNRRILLGGMGAGAIGVALTGSLKQLAVRAQDDPVKVGWSMASMEVQSYQVAQTVVENLAPSLNAEVIWTDAHNDVAQQVADVDNLLAQDPDVMVIHPVDTNAVAPLFDKVAERGIPSILFQRPARTTNFDLFVGGGTYDEGVMMGEFVGEQLGEEGGNVVIIQGDVGNDNAHNIHQGNVDALANYPQINIVVDQPSPLWSRERAQNIAEDALVQHDNDIQAIICANDDMAGGVAQALAARDLTGQIILVGGDGDRDAMERIQSGAQDATALQSFIELPAEALEIAVALARGEIDIESTYEQEVIAVDPPSDPVYRAPVPYTLITADNIEILEEYWQEIDELSAGE